MNLTHSTQEAIKVGLAVALAILAAMWFGWDKTYWSAITVYVIAATESYSYAIKKSQNRLVGTVIGISFAFFLLAFFPQNHPQFIFFYCLFLMLCVYFSSHHHWGYAMNIAFTVCAIVVCSGGFEASTTFDIAILRMQQTVLGIVVYSLVFRFVWPKKTEDIFFKLLQQAHVFQKQALSKRSTFNASPQKIALVAQQKQRLNKLEEMLSLPLNGSHRLRHQRETWRLITRALRRIALLLDMRQQGDVIHDEDLILGEKLINESMLSIKSAHLSLQKWLLKTEHSYQLPLEQTSCFTLPLKKRLNNVAKAFSILITCLLMWVFIPLPGGFLVPMIASIFANVFVTLPDNAIKHALLGCIIWGLFFLSQYVLLMPTFTEAWQIAGLCFINAIIIWKSCHAPSFAIQKILAGNLAVILPMSALQLTPDYSLQLPLVMLMLVFICLGVAGFYIKLFNNL